MARMARIATLRWIRVYVDKPARLGIPNLFDMSHILKITASPPILANPNWHEVCHSEQSCDCSDVTLAVKVGRVRSRNFSTDSRFKVEGERVAGERIFSSCTARPKWEFYSIL
jgi:hypothetical protein